MSQAGVFPMGQRKIAAYLRVNFSPAFLAQRVGGRPRREALIEGTWCVIKLGLGLGSVTLAQRVGGCPRREALIKRA